MKNFSRLRVLLALILFIFPPLFGAHVHAKDQKAVSLSGGATNIRDVISSSEYLICIDGGGSKTELQILDRTGKVLPITQGDDIDVFAIRGKSTNINSVGKERAVEALQGLFRDLRLGKEKRPFSEVLHKSGAVIGMAGAGSNRLVIEDALQDMGFSLDQVFLSNDAALALELVEDSGVVLIAGTGSICLGKKQGTIIRAGGLGHRIGDEGSGFHIGMQAIKAAMKDERDWGEETALTEAIKRHFTVDRVMSLGGPINQGTATPKEIAGIAPIVFRQAFSGDAVAMGIIDQAARDLSEILSSTLEKIGTPTGKIYLVGGVFKGEYAKELVQKILNAPRTRQLGIELAPFIVDISRENTATAATQKIAARIRGNALP